MGVNYWVLWLILSAFVVSASRKYRSDAYPHRVPKYNVRIDPFTLKPVVSGLIHTLPLRSSLADFRRHLQCAVKEPNMNYNNGMISRMRMNPPTSKDYKTMCSYVEARCGEWNECNGRIKSFDNGSYEKKRVPFNQLSGWSIAEFLRVINGTLHYDWPWGIDRLNKTCPANPVSPLINATLSRISDMRDSAFFTGGADPGLYGFDRQIPLFSHCTHTEYADIIAPWINMWMTSLTDYRKALKMKSNFTEADYIRQEDGYKPWQDKVPKAAVFTSVMQHRIFFYDIARKYPDLVDSTNEFQLERACLLPWNPLSKEMCPQPARKWPSPEEVASYQSLPPGYVLPLFNVTHQGYTRYYPGAYKYVVVPLGKQKVPSTSARIIHVMFYSGAVAILPRTMWTFHFQAQLIPWVHYVPISYTGADLAEKVQWLKDHDDLAQQIAENGRNFARSYMRLEDFYCYTANWLDVMAELNAMTDAAKVTFNPQVYPEVCQAWKDHIQNIVMVNMISCVSTAGLLDALN